MRGKQNTTWDLFLGLCLRNWRHYCSERWGARVIMSEGFHNIGPGVGIRLLGLTVLKFLFWPVEAVPSRGCCQYLLPGNVKGAPSSPGSLLHVLFADRMAIPGEVNGNPLQYTCLENPMNREDWQATVHGVAKSWTQLSNSQTHTPLSYFSKDENGINNTGAATDIFNTPSH